MSPARGLSAYTGNFAVAGSVVWRDVPGEIVLFESASGAYYALNPSATEIWRGLANGFTLDETAGRLAEMFDEARPALISAAIAFAERATQLGLLSRTSP